MPSLVSAKNHCIILTTAGSTAEGTRLARLLIKKRVAACVNILPGVKSIYRWKGTLEEGREVQLIIKTSRACVKEISEILRQHHSYELPEFIVLALQKTEKNYLLWMNKSLRSFP